MRTATESTPRRWRDALLAGVDGEVGARLEELPELDGALAAGIARTQEAWPWYAPADSLLTLLGAGLDAAEVAADALADRRWEDLALLDGFRRHVPEATRLVEGVLCPRAVAGLVRRGARVEDAEDLVQDRLCRMLGAPREIGYSGRGRLAGWLRRCVVHDWLNLQRGPRTVSEIEALPALASVLHDEALVGRHRDDLEAAIAEACRALSAEDRQLLRLVHVDRLSARQVGAILGLHRVSVQRRLARVREELRDGVISELGARVDARRTEVSSLLRAFAGRYDATVSRLLQSSDDLSEEPA